MIYIDPSYGNARAVAGSGFTAEQQFFFGLAGYRGVRTNLFGTQLDRWWNPDSMNLELDFNPLP